MAKSNWSGEKIKALVEAIKNKDLKAAHAIVPGKPESDSSERHK